MSRSNGRNGKRTLQPLRGERPPNVEGRMRRRHLINELNRWAKEDAGDHEEEEACWQLAKEGLRNTS